jgi:capsular polysaccharide biosynthesis protein
VFLYDRTDSNRRRLANSTAIKYRLEAQYDVKVDLWGEEWKNASKNQTWQAEVYNSYQYILAPHGAHFFNLIYTRPETKVVEIQCQMIYQNIRAFHQQWFAVWAPFVDIQFRVFTEDQGCREDGKLLKNYSPSWVFANITLLVEEAAKHFGLHKRREGLGM